MYRQVETTKEIILHNGTKSYPIATLRSDAGGMCQICIDDGCYILRLDREHGYIDTTHIFAEAFEVLKTLPPLNIQ